MPSPVFGSGTMLEPILVGVAASLVNFIIHGLLLACVVRAVQKLRLHDSIVPSFLRHALVIVATGALLVAGHFAEVIVWAITYHLVGAAPCGGRPRLPRLRQLHDPRLQRSDAVGAMAASRCHDRAQRHHADRLVDGADDRDPSSRHARACQDLTALLAASA